MKSKIYVPLIWQQKSSLQLNRSTKDQLQIIRTVSTQVKKLQH
ncbi:hypothetical protein CUZ95_2902 [Enterococcus lactis]|nr:hypothetical protein [Enterococcus lactis]